MSTDALVDLSLIAETAQRIYLSTTLSDCIYIQLEKKSPKYKGNSEAGKSRSKSVKILKTSRHDWCGTVPLTFGRCELNIRDI